MLPGLFSSLWLTVIISSTGRISAITAAVSGVLGEDVGSNTAANSWQGRRTVAEACVGNTIELRFTDKESFFFSPLSACQRQNHWDFSAAAVRLWPEEQARNRVSRRELRAETKTEAQLRKHMVLPVQQLLLSKSLNAIEHCYYRCKLTTLLMCSLYLYIFFHVILMLYISLIV